MNRSRVRSIDILDLDSVCGGATAAAPAAVMVRAGSLPSEVLKQLRGEVHDPGGDMLDPSAGLPQSPTGMPHTSAPTSPTAHAPAASHNTGNDNQDTGGDQNTDAPTGGSHAAQHGAHHAAPAHEPSEPSEPNDPAPRIASHGTDNPDFPNGVPLPPPRPASADLPSFMQHDAENRANGYYGAFGDAPTGPSQADLSSFMQHDADNRANGYYGAFGDAPTDAAHQINAMVPAPDYPTTAPHIDTTGVTPRYSDAELAQNRADTFSNYQDSASPTADAAPAAPAAPMHADDVPTGPTMVASNDEDQSSTVV